MESKGEAINDLEASKGVFENQCNSASGETLLKLLTSIQHIADEVGQLEVQILTDDYVPQTDSFKGATVDATAFLATLNSLKTTFAAIGQVAAAADKVVSYIK